MTQEPKCPQCQGENSYQDRKLWVCPNCGHEWNLSEGSSHQDAELLLARDAHGNTLQDGDAVTVIKDLKIKGSSSVVKVGTKVKNIKLIEGADDHNISCKIDGMGIMNLKSEFVKKS